MAAGEPRDFDSWASLISQVEQSSPDDIARISEAFDSFLPAFPLCYGYWKRYAGHKARLASVDAAVEVFERGVESAPYSVHLWDCYCGFAMLVYEDPDDVRRLFERGLSFVGKDYLCHLLWDKYLQLEYSQKQWNRLAHIYIRILRFPTKKLDTYYGSFEKLVATLNEEGICAEESSAEVGLNTEDFSVSKVINPPDSQELSCVVDVLMSPMVGPLSRDTLKKFLCAGQSLYQKASRIHEDIICFEKRIRRPYFHVKPLDDNQLDNWHEYLDFVLAQEDFDWTVKLHERCLIPCANYPEFWIRYVEYMEVKGGREMADYALVRATNVFLKDILEINLFCARIKELRGDDSGARAAYRCCKSEMDSTFLENIKRRANMEKRLGNNEAATDIYKEAVKISNGRCDIVTASKLYVDFCCFTYMLTGDPDAARDILIDGIKCFPHCKLLLEELMRFELMHGGSRKIDLVDSIISRALDSAVSLSSKDREDISRTYLEFVDHFGTIDDLNKAWTRHLKLSPHLLRHNHKEWVSSDSLTVERDKRKENGVARPHHVHQDHALGGTNQGAPHIEPPEIRTYQPQPETSHIEPPEIRTYQPQPEDQNGTEERAYGQEDGCRLDLHESPKKVHDLVQEICTISQAAKCPGESEPPIQQQRQQGQPPNDLEPPPIESLSIISEVDGKHLLEPTINESQFSDSVPSSIAHRVGKSERASLIGMTSQNENSQIYGTLHMGDHRSISRKEAAPDLKVSQQMGHLERTCPSNDANRESWKQSNRRRGNKAQRYRQFDAVYSQSPRQRSKDRPPFQKMLTSKGSNITWDQALPNEPPQGWQQISESQQASQTEGYYQPASNSYHPGSQIWSLQNSHQQNSSSSSQSPPISQMHTSSNQSPMPDSVPYNQFQNAQEYCAQMWHYYQQQQQYLIQLHQYQFLQLQQYQQQQEQSHFPQPQHYYAQQQLQEHLTQPQQEQHQQQSQISQYEQKQPSQSQMPPSQFQNWSDYYSQVEKLTGSCVQQAVPVQLHESAHYGRGDSQIGVSQVLSAGINDDESSAQHSTDHEQQSPTQ